MPTYFNYSFDLHQLKCIYGIITESTEDAHGTVSTQSGYRGRKAQGNIIVLTTLLFFAIIVTDNDLWWIKSMNLYQADLAALEKGDELNDNIINAAHSLLRRQFPHVSGLQDTLHGYKLTFKSVPSDTLSVQILHTGNYYTHTFLMKILSFL